MANSDAVEPPFGWLRGEKFYDAPKSIHRLFEEMLENSKETIALVYKG